MVESKLWRHKVSSTVGLNPVMGVFGTIPAAVHLTGHSPLQSLFGRPASQSIGPPLWVPGCFTTVFFGKQEIGWLATCYNNILYLRSHLFTPTHLLFSIALHQRSLSRPLVWIAPTWAGLSSGWNRFSGPSRCFLQIFGAKNGADPFQKSFESFLEDYYCA